MPHSRDRRRRDGPVAIGAALYRWRSAPEPTGSAAVPRSVRSGGSRVHSLSSSPRFPPATGSLCRPLDGYSSRSLPALRDVAGRMAGCGPGVKGGRPASRTARCLPMHLGGIKARTSVAGPRGRARARIQRSSGRADSGSAETAGRSWTVRTAGTWIHEPFGCAASADTSHTDRAAVRSRPRGSAADRPTGHLDVWWRRGWDSNPRSLSTQRFSRAPPSTARPPLQRRGAYQRRPAAWPGCRT